MKTIAYKEGGMGVITPSCNPRVPLEIPFITHRLLPRSAQAPVSISVRTKVCTAQKTRNTGLQKGDVLKEKYEILALIGEGGMSRVYLARDLELTNKQWAVKEVDRWATDPLGRPIEQSLTSEAELLSKLQHPTIVGIADIEKTHSHIYVIMDHVEGQSLDQVVLKQGPQSESDVQKWMLQICDALSYLHRQNPPIIYRDMKPNNIMLHPDGYVKLIDLGVAREYKDEQKKDTVAFGTTGYAAPEQYGKAQTDARTDVYGLGATMWHLLGGTPAPAEFPIRNVRLENPGVGEGFADVIIPKCMQLARANRYQTCEELAADLEVYQELTREYRQKQRRKVLWFAGCAVSAVTCVVLAIAVLGIKEAYITQNYEHYMSVAQAQVHSNPERAQQAYLAAIQEKPTTLDAYKGLITSYKTDGQFTVQEKAQLDEVYNTHVNALRASGNFAELSYEIGRLYWYFYSYAQTGTYQENQFTRIKASAEYFSNAAQASSFQQRDTAQNYAAIAQFVSSITTAVMQGDETEELYLTFWDNLALLAQRAEAESVEIVRLDSCALIANAIETYMGKFKAIGAIQQPAMETLLQQVCQNMAAMKLTTDQNKQLCNETLNRATNSTLPKITALYSAAAA